MRANQIGRDSRLAEKYLMSLVIDLDARSVKPEGHPLVPLKGPVDDEDVVAFASPRASDDVLGWQDKPNNRRSADPFPHRPNVRISWPVPPRSIAVLDLTRDAADCGEQRQLPELLRRR
jgi:hypothetical protein